MKLLRWPRIGGWVGRERGIAHAVVKLSRKFQDQFRAVALARFFSPLTGLATNVDGIRISVVL